MEHPVGNALVRLTATFEGHALTVITINDTSHWLARQVGEALGYSDNGGEFVRSIASNWSDELVEGTDYVKLLGEDLAAAKRTLGADVIDPRTPSLLLLTESGVFGAALLSRQPAAARLRRWLSAEVLPQLARTGAYAPSDVDLRSLPVFPALPPMVKLAFLGQLHARGVVSAVDLAVEMSLALGTPKPARMTHGAFDAVVPWLPVFPPWRMELTDWELIRDNITEWHPWVISIDLHARRLRGERGLGADFVGATYKGWTKEKALGSGIVWPAQQVDGPLVAAADWPDLRTWLKVPLSHEAAALDAAWRHRNQVISTWSELLDEWGWDSDEPDALAEAQFLIARFLRPVSR